MTAEDFNCLYGAVIAPNARVSVPREWLPAIQTAMQAICDLPTETRAFVIVTGLVEERGSLVVDVMAAVPFIPADGLQRLRDIIAAAQAAVRGGLH